MEKERYQLRNEKGYSFAEAMLTLTVTMVIFGSLLPISYRMFAKLHERKIDVHIAYTSHQAAIERENGILSGNRVVDKVNYAWTWEERLLCINYTKTEVTYQTCKNY